MQVPLPLWRGPLPLAGGVGLALADGVRLYRFAGAAPCLECQDRREEQGGLLVVRDTNEEFQEEKGERNDPEGAGGVREERAGEHGHECMIQRARP